MNNTDATARENLQANEQETMPENGHMSPDEQENELECHRSEIISEIAALDQLMRAQDYIGIKIAMGRATKEDYAEQIAQSEQWAQRKNKLEEILKEEKP